MKHHHIETLQCKLQIHDKKLHKPLQNQLMRFYDIGLFSILDKVFNKFATQGLVIAQILLSLPPIPEHSFAKDFLPSIETALTSFLEEYCKTLEASQKKNTLILPKKETLHTILTYLQKGYYPYSISESFMTLWQQAMQDDPKVLTQRLEDNLQQNMLQRLIYQLSEIKLWELVQQLYTPTISPIQQYYVLLQKAGLLSSSESNTKHIKNYAFWYALLRILLDPKERTLPIAPLIDLHLKYYTKNTQVSTQYIVTQLKEHIQSFPNSNITKLLHPILSKHSLHLNASTLLNNDLDRTTWLVQIAKDIEEDVFPFSVLNDTILNTLSTKEREFLMFSFPFTTIERLVSKKTPYVKEFYSKIASQFSSTITRQQFKDFLFRFACGYFLQKTKTSSTLAHFIVGFNEYIQQTNHIDYSKKQEYITKTNITYHNLIQDKNTFSAETLTSTTSTTINIILHLLKHGCFPAHSNTITTYKLDRMFGTLFQSSTSSFWKKKYSSYRHKGHEIFSSVLEKYIAQEAHRILYIVKLDHWYPLHQRELFYLTNGMQKKQQRQSDFAKQLVQTLPEKALYAVIGYIEPVHQNLVFSFVKNSVFVAEIQSLTDKLTDFKKAVYTFVLSYILLRKGYSFSKQQFVAVQIKQLALHFNITYNAILQLFLNTLNANTTFGKTKELYAIIRALQTGEKEFTKEDKFVLISSNVASEKEDITSHLWIELFLYYLNYQAFPLWSTINTIEALVQEIPITVNTEEKVISFLNSKKSITQFLKSKMALQYDIALTDLCRFILHEKKSRPHSIKKIINLTNGAEKKTNKAIDGNTWSIIFLYYLRHRSFPWWTTISDFETLVQKIPIDVYTEQKIVSFLKSQSDIIHFLNFKIAKQYGITLISLCHFILYKKEPVHFITKHSKKPKQIITKTIPEEVETTHWVSVLLYYLEHQELPWWSSFSNLELFLKNSKTDKTSLKRLTIFFQKNKNTPSFWKTIDHMSKEKLFRKVLLQWLVPSIPHLSAIHILTNLFSPLGFKDEILFSKHFGILPDGSLFWKYLWSSRRLFFSDSSNSLVTFWTSMYRQYPLHSAAFNLATLTSLKEKKEAKIWSTIISTPISKTILQKDVSKIDVNHLVEQLFDTSKKMTPEEIQQLKNKIQVSPISFINTINKIFYEKNITKTELTALYTHWLTILFPEIKVQLLSIFNEFGILEKYFKDYTFNTYRLTGLFIWKASNRYQFKSTSQYLQTLFLELAQHKKIPFNDLIVQYYNAIYTHRKTLPKLYQGMMILQLDHSNSSIQQKDQKLSQETNPSKKVLEIEENLGSIPLLNSGIVLLWKFMPMFFEKLHLWNPIEKEFYDQKAKNKAVLALYYLTTGNTKYPDEHGLLIMKLLCGLPLHFSLFEDELNEEEKLIAESLITSAIYQWQKLGTLSIEGFRNTFLTRSGILDIEEEVQHITIQSTGIDVLLDYLPWTISKIRLPWLDKKIHVSWREQNII